MALYFYWQKMRRIGLTKGKYALVDDEDFEYLNKFRWHTSSNSHRGYAVRETYVKGKRKKVFMHKEIIHVPDGFEGDHINLNKLGR